jgi:hypothetical protein
MLHQKLKIRLTPNRDLTPVVDIAQTSRKPGFDTTVESTPGKVETAKKMPAPDMSIIMQQKTWENAQLTKELKYQRRKNGASMYLLEEVKLVVDTLQQALVNFQKLNTEFEDDSMEN